MGIVKRCGCTPDLYCRLCEPERWAEAGRGFLENGRLGYTVTVNGQPVQVTKEISEDGLFVRAAWEAPAAHDTFTGAKVTSPTITISDPHGDLLREIRDLLKEIRAYSETAADYLSGLYERGK